MGNFFYWKKTKQGGGAPFLFIRLKMHKMKMSYTASSYHNFLTVLSVSNCFNFQLHCFDVVLFKQALTRAQKVKSRVEWEIWNSYFEFRDEKGKSRAHISKKVKIEISKEGVLVTCKLFFFSSKKTRTQVYLKLTKISI